MFYFLISGANLLSAKILMTTKALFNKYLLFFALPLKLRFEEIWKKKLLESCLMKIKVCLKIHGNFNNKQ